MWCGVWKRLLVVPSNPFSTYSLLIKPLVFIWAHGCPKSRLHFLPSLAAGYGQVIQFWTMGSKRHLCVTAYRLSYEREIHHSYPHPTTHLLSLDKGIVGGDNKESSLSLGTNDPEKELYLRL